MNSFKLNVLSDWQHITINSTVNWVIWIYKATSNLMYQINAVEMKYKVVENGNTQAK